MNTPHNKQQSMQAGFSLVEVLVYLFVLILVAGAVVATYLSLDAVLLRNRAERMVTHDATVTLERVVRAIREAESVNVGLSTLGSSPGTLALTDGATTTTFSVSGGNLSLTINGITKGPLTSDGVTVQNLVFRRYDNTDTELVRITLTLSTSNKAASTTRTFYSSAVVRGSYE